MSPRHDDLPFDPHAPEKEMQAAKLPWRFAILCTGIILVVVAALAFDRTIVERWWPFGDRDRERPTKQLLAAFDVNAAGWEPVPPMPPEPIVLQVDRLVHPLTTELAPPPPAPAAPPPRQVVTIEKVGQAGLVSYAPAERAPLDMLDGRVASQAQGCALMPGLSVIHAAFQDEIRWDMGGQVEATVTRPVESPERPGWVLIPEGASLVGQASVEPLQRGMDLAPAPVWQYVSWIDSDTGERRTRNLQGASSANASGVNGIGGQVDARWGPIFGLMALETVFGVIGNISINVGNSSDSVNTTIDGRSVDSIGSMVARRLLDVEPTITTKAGTQFFVRPRVPIRMC